MLTQIYLSLKLWRLKQGEEWSHGKSGLTFIFPKAGSGRFIAGATAGRVTAGDVLVMDGTARGKLWAPDRSELVFSWFSACSEHLFPLFAGGEICLVRNMVEEFKRGKLYPASSEVAREAQRLLGEVSPEFNLHHRSQLLRVLATILTDALNTVHTHHHGEFVRAEDHLNQVLENLSAAEMLELSVGELAGRFGCSRRHLNRLFHQHFGVSVATLRMEMRLSKAVSLLRDPDAKVIRVAEECGFNHLGLFNTCFKRRFGVSPGKWRRGETPAKMQTTHLWDGNADCPMLASGLCPWSKPKKASRGAATAPPQTNKPSSIRLMIGQPKTGNESRALILPHEKFTPAWRSRPSYPAPPAT